MSSLISDVLSGAITHGVCNAAVNAGGKLLKVIDMTYRYGKPGKSGRPSLLLAESESADARQDRIAAMQAELDELKRAA